MPVSPDMIRALRDRYASLHPVLFLRSVEKAKNATELFDILDTVPELPVVWCEDKRSWITVTGLLQGQN